MAFSYSLSRLFEIVGSEHTRAGGYEGEVRGIASLAEAGEGDLSFLGNRKYREEALRSEASVLLVPSDFEAEPKPGQLQIRVANPSYALALICRDIEASLFPRPPAGIHPSAVVEEGAEVSPEASVGALCYIGAGARVGACVLQNHVSIGRYAEIGDETLIFARSCIGDYCRIGRRNRILPGAIVGGEGYGYEFMEGAHQRVPQVGIVETEDSVDIGANTTIDRARFGATRIGEGTKVDNLVQIAHNVRIGRNCLLVAQVGISGSTRLGDGVVIGGQAGVAGHLSIASGANIAGGSAVTRSIKEGETVRGYPAEPIMLFNRIAVLQRRLPELFKRFDQLEERIEAARVAASE